MKTRPISGFGLRRALALRAAQLLLILSVLAGAACTRLPEVPGPDQAQLEAVLEPPPQVTPTMLAEPEVQLTAMSPEMQRFVEAVVPPHGSKEQRIDALFQTLRDNAAFMMNYQANATLTGAEAFRQRRANCLAFSAMFIAMARHAGVDARFQQVDVPPTWDSETGNTLVQYQHVNVTVELSRRTTGVIDFRVDLYDERFPKRVLSDAEALAHFYSNISMERLFEGRLGEAWVAARRALEADREQGFVWNNMGIILRRLGRSDLAEASYRQALVLNPRDWSAAGNLSQIYGMRGDDEEAARLRALGDLIKLRNPYYRFALAQRAYRSGAYDEALAQLDVAVGKLRNDPRFYYLRALSLWQLGEAESAVDNVKRAIRVATEQDRMALYRRQLEEWEGPAQKG